MSKRYPFVLALVACLLVGCGDKEELSSAPSVITTVSITTPAVTTTTDKTAATTASSEATSLTTSVVATTVAPAVKTAPPAASQPVQLSPAKTLEVYEGVTLQDLLASAPVQLADANAPLDTGRVGQFEVPVSFTYSGNTYEQMLRYTVQDTKPPILLNGGYQTKIKVGTAFDLNQYVGYADNYDATPTLRYSGQVNPNVPGQYPLHAVVTDDCGNRLNWDLTVEVVAQLPANVDNAPRLPFESFAQQYGGAGKKLGIDVSKWQGQIDFRAVKNAGCSFVLMRIGHDRNGVEMDEYYRANMAAAKAAGLEVGVYFYCVANNAEDVRVRARARWICEQLGGQPLDYPVVFDWESFSNFQKYSMSIHDLNVLFEVFADEMAKGGYHAMLYSSKNFLNNFWESHPAYPVWLAHYTSQTDYTGRYSIWQASCRGRIPGIAGDVDLNVQYMGVPLF